MTKSIAAIETVAFADFLLFTGALHLLVRKSIRKTRVQLFQFSTKVLLKVSTEGKLFRLFNITAEVPIYSLFFFRNFFAQSNFKHIFVLGNYSPLEFVRRCVFAANVVTNFLLVLLCFSFYYLV